MSINNKSIAQLRLLIPREMVEELDTLASSRNTTRLGLIRDFLSRQIANELSQLEAYLDDLDRRRSTHSRLRQHLLEKE